MTEERLSGARVIVHGKVRLHADIAWRSAASTDFTSLSYWNRFVLLSLGDRSPWRIMTSKVPIPTLDPNKLKEEESWKPDPKDIDDDGNPEIPTEN